MASVFRADSRSMSSAACSPVALLIPCGSTITRLRLNTCTSGNSSVRVTSSNRGPSSALASTRHCPAVNGIPRRPSSLTNAPGIDRHKRSRVAAARKVNDGAVLGDNGIDEVKVTGHSNELGEDATRDEKDEDASGPQRSNRVTHRFVGPVPIRDRTVVVERDCCELHRGLHPASSAAREEPPFGDGEPCAGVRHREAVTGRAQRRQHLVQ